MFSVGIRYDYSVSCICRISSPLFPLDIRVTCIVCVSFVTTHPLHAHSLTLTGSGDIYSRVQDNVENEWMLERLKILLEIESLLSDSMRRNEEVFPTFLHVLEPKLEKKIEESRQQKALDELLESNKSLKEKFENQFARKLQDIQNIETKLEQRMKELEIRNGGLENEMKLVRNDLSNSLTQIHQAVQLLLQHTGVTARDVQQPPTTLALVPTSVLPSEPSATGSSPTMPP